MNEMQKKMAERLGLNENDFKGRSKDQPTQLDRIEAQTMYTALMTDTLLEEDTDNV